MASAMFSSGEFNFGVGLGGGGGEKLVSGKRVDNDAEFEFHHGVKPLDEDFFLSKYQQQERIQQNLVFDQGLLDDFISKGAADPGDHGVGNVEQKKDRRCSSSMASLELLRSYGNGVKKLDGDRIVQPRGEEELNENSVAERLSIEGIARLAGVKFVQGPSSTMDVHSVLGPFGLAFAGLSDEEKQEVQLIELLLVCAEKVTYRQFDRARNLLNQCSYLFSNQGTPVQRLVHYFAEALHERIDRETGRLVLDDFWKINELTRDLLVMNPNRSRIALHQEIPFSQVAQFTGLQAIIEKVTDAKRIHAIDMCIGSGAHWTILMQALQNSELELLKITAIGTHSQSQHLMEVTGKRLESFAGAMNLPFSFRLVIVDDLSDLKEDHLKVDFKERLVVYSQYYLRTLIGRPNQLDALMKVIAKLNPSLMVVTEPDANHNSPSFVDRFIETLFFFCAYFDCLETYMKRLDENRLAVESFYFGESIKNIVATEGDERTVRNVKIDVWRAFFARFGMVEDELSPSSLYQASLVTKRFRAGRFCTLDRNGKSLIVGWKNTPILSLSVWKFT
ncbi:hypothetical protein CRG98_015922 [Punica granatum]|uniref:Uncharacterized protein n=1 Tax=Punica granatum TaxID=22663 RepID=A0A2I0K6B9_PUNGR|nr:hypothetical protein CRG98_015922 [Punica granatum]